MKTAIAVIIFLGFTSGIQAHNHPKQMTGTAKVQAKSNTINSYSLAFAIDTYIKKEARKQGGVFTFFDSVKDKSLALKLDHVHNDKLCYLGDDEYFACADFINNDGVKYDLDILMRGKNAKELKVREVMLHKVGEKLRFDWAVKDGIWRKVPAKADSTDL